MSTTIMHTTPSSSSTDSEIEYETDRESEPEHSHAQSYDPEFECVRTHANRFVADAMRFGANVRASTFESSEIEAVIENWADLDSDLDRVLALELATRRNLLVPDRSYSHNSTSVDLHEYLCHSLAGSGESRVVETLAVGRDESEPTPTQRTLGDRIGQTEIASADVDRRTIYVNTFVGSGEFNGNTIREIGLYAGTRLVNRALITPTPKDATKTITIEAAITISDASEIDTTIESPDT